ncbi:MAG TPA: undecaprenyl-diphosphate phosphatase [Bacillota bacterium]|nr:undecaprenyl-diphosphate phosphatase [Bacillota bacterium]HPF42278.1 undecaprenyl-diphosphate phosphatase [Bacillota bacterium]HPJ86112.1 undecaprenyl-diphosphate phosphatase [Bacillota bacterium]HPQ61955.1 undecaprenyl-diphosphate phosphatase [Bacillota bacterium]
MDILELLKYLLLGLIQGLAEVLPVSSTGQVELVRSLIGVDVEKELLFLILLNTGSFIVLLFAFRRQIGVLIRDFFRYIFSGKSHPESKPGFVYCIKLILATLPAAVVGLFFRHKIDGFLLNYGTLFSGIGLLVTGTVLLYVGFGDYRHQNGKIGWLDSVLIGAGQALALIPGISRSGMTTSIALKRGVDIDSALDFSFLMYLPVSFGGLVLLLLEASGSGFSVPSPSHYVYYAVAFLGAAGFTYLAFRIIYNVFRSGKLKYFGYFCLATGILSLIVYAF